jgi:hypothetical protein
MWSKLDADRNADRDIGSSSQPLAWREGLVGPSSGVEEQKICWVRTGSASFGPVEVAIVVVSRLRSTVQKRKLRLQRTGNGDGRGDSVVIVQELEAHSNKCSGAQMAISQSIDPYFPSNSVRLNMPTCLISPSNQPPIPSSTTSPNIHCLFLSMHTHQSFPFGHLASNSFLNLPCIFLRPIKHTVNQQVCKPLPPFFFNNTKSSKLKIILNPIMQARFPISSILWKRHIEEHGLTEIGWFLVRSLES